MKSVGDNIDAYCLKCKLLLAHVILFKVDGVVSRVKCKTCGAEHKYRPGGGATVKKERGERVVAKKPAASKSASASKQMLSDAQAAQAWDLKIRNRKADAPVHAYSIYETYKTGDIINHPTFGLGFVEKILSDKSMSVLFSNSIKLLGMSIV